MDIVEDLITKIRTLSENYQPNASVKQVIGEKIMVPIIGPFATGKSTLMKKIEREHTDFSYVRGFTTRPMREKEDPGTYNFYPHGEETLERLIDELENGELVQVAVHPSTGYIYGSDLDSYVQKYNVLDVLTSAMAELESLPFKDIIPIFIVCPVADWHARLKDRELSASVDEFRKRFVEARASLEWALEHQANIHWVTNSDGNLAFAAQRIVEVATQQKPEHYKEQIEIAEQMLASIFI